jgi:hypothetical protein
MRSEGRLSKLLLFISPIFIPIALWLFYAYGFEIIMRVFFIVWQFVWGFFDGSLGDSGFDPNNKFE